MKQGLLITIFMLMLSGCSAQEKTNAIFLFPSEFEGTVVIYYNIPDQPTLKNEQGFSVIPVKEEHLTALEGTGLETYGLYFTSTRDMNYGMVNNQYFYVDEKGKRTPINENCVHIGHNGILGAGSGAIPYQLLYLTKSQCSEEYMVEGNEDYDTQSREVENYWIGRLLYD